MMCLATLRSREDKLKNYKDLSEYRIKKMTQGDKYTKINVCSPHHTSNNK